MQYKLEMNNISKSFGDFQALNNLSLKVKNNEVHALLGENGAGKSTLMKILFGLYAKDSGTILIDGIEQEIDNPRVANQIGIGMVHQHFKLVDVFTVAENIILGSEPKKGLTVDIKSVNKKIEEISNKYNLNINPKKRVSDLTVGEQQRVEIIKVLYKHAEIIIFDEPTAVLTPQEIKEFFNIVRKLKDEGKTIILISHKLKEIKEVCETCTVIRRGEFIDQVEVATTPITAMAEKMVGRVVSFKTEKKESTPGKSVLKIENLVVKSNVGHEACSNINLELFEGEILGIAGVDGNGQTELLEALFGLRKISSGKVNFMGDDITNLKPRKINEKGIVHIPEDRLKHALVEELKFKENMILMNYYTKQFSNNLKKINWTEVNNYSEKIVEKFDVRLSSIEMEAGGLSGGNQQKAVIGRELQRDPSVVLVSQPTRGVDVGAIEFIHSELIQERDRGAGILLVSYDLDEVMNLADRIAVIFKGQIVDIVDVKNAKEQEIGFLMAGGQHE